MLPCCHRYSHPFISLLSSSLLAIPRPLSLSPSLSFLFSFSISFPHPSLSVSLFTSLLSLTHVLPSFSPSLSLSLFSFFSSFLYLPHRHEFCWICMQDWTLHSNVTGGYFQCNRFDANAARAEGDGGSQADADSQTQG